uniref:Short-chain dehydrogenase/reductase n=1 Tax=Opuntia streptacantha TaxID=393608 RepID=A0A7C9D1R6_OPUST
MAELSAFLAKKRYAVVTGGNKGIGLEICRQLASQGLLVIMTARDEKRGIEALENLKKSGINPDDLVFHQLDVTDSNSVASLADFIKAKFGKLDILVNNAAINGVILNPDALAATLAGTPGVEDNLGQFSQQTYELAEECIRTNYYGAKRTIEVLLPLLQLSDSPRIVNVSSSLGKLKLIPSERIRKILGDIDNLAEEKINQILNDFLRDFKDGLFVSKGWPPHYSAYIMSKAALNALTRILAKKYPSIIINAICPGFVKTDMTGNKGFLSVEEGGASPTKLALMPPGSPSGLFYVRFEVSSFDE